MDNSPLNRLPLELRLDIYERVVTFNGPLRVTLNHPDPWQHTLNPAPSPQKDLLAITEACRKTAREARPLVFRANTSWTFALREDLDYYAAWLHWATRVYAWSRQFDAAALHSVRSVQFDVGTWDSRPSADMPVHENPDFAVQIFRNLPAEFQRASIAFSMLVKIHWSSGFELPGGGMQHCDPIPLAVPMWGSRESTLDSVREPVGAECVRVIDLLYAHADELADRVREGSLGGWNEEGTLQLADLGGLETEIVALVDGAREFEACCAIVFGAQMLPVWLESARTSGSLMEPWGPFRGRLVDRLRAPFLHVGLHGGESCWYWRASRERWNPLADLGFG